MRFEYDCAKYCNAGTVPLVRVPHFRKHAYRTRLHADNWQSSMLANQCCRFKSFMIIFIIFGSPGFPGHLFPGNGNSRLKESEISRKPGTENFKNFNPNQSLPDTNAYHVVARWHMSYLVLTYICLRLSIWLSLSMCMKKYEQVNV